MSDQYMKELLRIAVAQICQTIGYNATQTAPLELLQDVLDKFLREFTRDLRRQVEHYNRTEANLNDVTLTLNSINVNLNELLDYINNVEPVPFALEVPKFPARKESALNFLKPGSKEVLTRRVHVHDHLPPMLPPEVTQPTEIPLNAFTTNGVGDTKSFSENSGHSNSNGETSNDLTNKNPNASHTLDKSTLQSLFKPSSNFEDGERPTREVSSVVMTTGGYISPAVEGKMPEAMVPDIIDKLLGLDAPPPPPPPPPPPQPKPVPRSATSTPIPSTVEKLNAGDKDIIDRGDNGPSTSKETKKALSRSLEPQPVINKKLEQYNELLLKKDKIFSGKTQPHDAHPPMPANYNKKSFMMHQNASGIHTPQTNYANMLLKKAKKQKVPLMPGQVLAEKHVKPLPDKMHKLDAADKAHRKYMKMLQKMAKQGKIPPEILGTIMGPDKKSKMINPDIVASMPPGPEKIQLEKLLRKQAKQRQKMMKQQMLMEAQKQAKKPIQPPPLVPIFPPTRMPDAMQKPLNVEVEDSKIKTEQKDLTNVSPVKSAFTPTMKTSPQMVVAPPMIMTEPALSKTPKTEISTVLEIFENPPLTSVDGKELKLSNEPDRTKLNIFKKISKQKTPKSSSPTPMRVMGHNDTPIINLPSGTTITPAPGPVSASNVSLTNTPVGRNLFPPLPNDGNIGNPSLDKNNVINVDDIKDKQPIAATAPNINPNQPTDLTMIKRVFGEKPIEAVELVNKPKKRGRKPGSKNSPKIPGVFPNNLLKKNSKKANMANSNLFIPRMGQLPQDIRPVLGKKANMMNNNLFGSNIPQLNPDFLGGLSKKANLGTTNLFGANFSQLPQEIRSSIGNLKFDNMAQFFSNPMQNTDWSQNKQLQQQQQMMIMAGAKERKEHKKKNKLLKQDLLNNDNKLGNVVNMPTPPLAVPTNEEVQSINKKLMRMDTILKAAPSNQTTDLTVDTSLIGDKKLNSPSIFPVSTSPLKSPGNSKRLMPNTDNLPGSLVQPFMLPNRPPFPNLPGNMLSMLQFPFPTRPGLIPTPGLFPTPGLAPFPNNPKNPLLPGIFPFPNLKQPLTDNTTSNQESEDLSTDKNKLDTNLQSTERSYCNVAPLVPDFLTKLNDNNTNTSSNTSNNEPDLPKTPKPRNAHSSSNLSQDNFVKKMSEAHTPESAAGSLSGKSIPSTPGGISLNTFEQLMKKNDSPIDLIPLNKHSKSLTGSQESGLDFSMSKKQNHSLMGGDLTIKTPITLNNEPIEVSDDSDETNQPPPPPSRIQTSATSTNNISQPNNQQSHNSFSSMDDMFAANTGSHLLQKPLESDLSIKELKKLKKQVKKSSSSLNAATLIGTDKTDGLGATAAQTSGVGKLAGGADLIPLASTGLAYSSKNIPYNSLTATANPTFNAHKNDFNSSNPTSSSAASSSVFDNLTITAAIPSSSGNNSASLFDIQKKRKEHKKLKKLKELKEGKIKKKKDKKDKNKSKEKAEKYLMGQTQSSPSKEKDHLTLAEPVTSTPAPVVAAHSSGMEKIKDKDLIKKLKKEKKKEKQRTVLEDLPTKNPSFLQVSAPLPTTTKEKDTSASNTSLGSGESESKKQKLSPISINTVPADIEPETAANSSSTTIASTASLVPKLTLKLGSTHSPTPPRDDGHKSSITATASSAKATTVSPPPREHQREPSPELARISPLVTRPPKHKLNTSGEMTSTSAAVNTISAANASSLDIGESSKATSATSGSMVVPPPSPWLSGGTISASSVLLPHQLLQTTKQHDVAGASASATNTADTSTKTPNVDRQSPLTLITETSRPSSYIDAEGNRVWICPACGKVDDGSPMIGCDGCDAWYHWVCVGIFVAPKDNEDWFCRVCITRKKGLHGSDKKRKRNKKK